MQLEHAVIAKFPNNDRHAIFPETILEVTTKFDRLCLPKTTMIPQVCIHYISKDKDFHKPMFMFY